MHNILHYHSKQIFSLCIGWQPTTWPANNCLQIKVCSCAIMSSYCVWLQIIFCSCMKETWPFSLFCGRSFVKMAASRRYLSKNKLGHWMIKQYWTWLSKNIMICQCLADQLFAPAFGFRQTTVHFTVAIQVEMRLELTITLPPLLCKLICSFAN